MLRPTRAAERGVGRANCPGPRGLRGLINEHFDILTTGNALKCIFSQSKGRDRKIFCSNRW